MDLNDIAAALRRSTSLDPQPDMPLWQEGVEAAAGFIPGIGQAMAARDLERARRAGDPVAAAGAAASFVPWGRAIGKAKIIAGKAAKYFPEAEKAVAEGMEAAGHSKSDIWRTAGLERTPEGHWGFEIPDQPSKLAKPEMEGGVQHWGGKATDVIDHPEFYKNYPHAENFDVYARGDPNIPKGYGEGSFDPTTKEILVSAHPDEVHSIILHELQHGVQQAEGWSGGTNPTAIANALRSKTPDATGIQRVADQRYMRNMGEAQARAVQKRLENSEQFNEKIRPGISYDINPDNLLPQHLYP